MTALRFQRPTLPPADAVERYFARSREQRWFSNEGPCWGLLRDRLSTAVGRPCVPVASGTLGLMVGLRALVRRMAVPTATRVLLPSFTFPATAQAAIWNRLDPVLVDIDADHWHLSPAALERALQEQGRAVAAIVAVSAFGTPPPADVRRAWQTLADNHGAPLLVDSAAGYGAVAGDGVPIGAQGDVEVVSFHATKPLAAGEGGAVFARDPEVAEEIRRLSNFGFDERRAADAHGLNAKLDEHAAATALAALDALPAALAARRSLAERILAGIGGELVTQRGRERSTWQFVPLAARDADHRRLMLDSADGRVELRTYYEPLHRMPAFRGAGGRHPLTVTDALGDRILSLPMAVDLTDSEVEAVVAAVAGERTRSS